MVLVADVSGGLGHSLPVTHALYVTHLQDVTSFKSADGACFRSARVKDMVCCLAFWYCTPASEPFSYSFMTDLEKFINLGKCKIKRTNLSPKAKKGPREAQLPSTPDYCVRPSTCVIDHEVKKEK